MAWSVEVGIPYVIKLFPFLWYNGLKGPLRLNEVLCLRRFSRTANFSVVLTLIFFMPEVRVHRRYIA